MCQFVRPPNVGAVHPRAFQRSIMCQFVRPPNVDAVHKIFIDIKRFDSEIEFMHLNFDV
jgi:hypothetical protein